MSSDIKSNSAGQPRVWPNIIMLVTLMFSASCAPNHNAIENGSPEVKRTQVDPRRPSPIRIQNQLQAEYQKWRGTRHRLGGNSRAGVDCSGFVKAVYQEIFGIDLPRTTQAQATLGRPVKKSDLKAGDLVFFKPPSYPRHVGIYLNNSEFVHASKSKGVTISRITPDYWGKYFWTARRLLTH